MDERKEKNRFRQSGTGLVYSALARKEILKATDLDFFGFDGICFGKTDGKDPIAE